MNEWEEWKGHKAGLNQLQVGRYADQVIADVVSIQAYYVLLDRPWEYNLRANLEGMTNYYNFVKDGQPHS